MKATGGTQIFLEVMISADTCLKFEVRSSKFEAKSLLGDYFIILYSLFIIHYSLFSIPEIPPSSG